MHGLPELLDGDLRLAPLLPEHVGDDYVRWLNDPDINRYLESRFVHHTLDSTRSFVAAARDDGATAMFGIWLDGRHVGNIKLGPIDRHHGRGEIGILIGERAVWGRGIATRAISAISQFAFTALSLRKLTAGCYSSNKGSLRAFERAGFSIEAVRARHYAVEGGLEDLLLLARFS